MNKKDLKLIASFYASPMFGAFKRMVQERVEKLKEEEAKRENEFETVYQLALLTGRKKELIELLKTLEMCYKRFSE